MSNSVDLGFDGPLCVADVETTGLDSKTDRVISVALLNVDFEELGEDTKRMEADAMFAVVDPDHPIHPEASAVNGFKSKDLKGKPLFAEEAPVLREFIGRRTLVGHNVSFDKRFLNAEFKRAEVKALSRNRSACTMNAIQALMASVGRHGAKWGRMSLDEACILFGVGERQSKYHSASEDVTLTLRLAYRLYELSKLSKQEAKEEIRELVELWSDSARTGRARSYSGRRGGASEEDEGDGGCLGASVAMIIVAVILWLLIV